MTDVALIDYGMGNLRSVENALTMAGAVCTLVETPDQVEAMSLMVLPGVGAFGDGMRALEDRGWPAALPALVDQGKSLFGICLGMQLLADVGTEHGEFRGLGLIPGRVEHISADRDLPVRIPHMGWDDVDITQPSGLFDGLRDQEVFYFVHSYVFEPDVPETVIATCDYGRRFAVAVRSGQITGVQFHPEKSQRVGLSLLRNLLAESVEC